MQFSLRQSVLGKCYEGASGDGCRKYRDFGQEKDPDNCAGSSRSWQHCKGVGRGTGRHRNSLTSGLTAASFLGSDAETKSRERIA